MRKLDIKRYIYAVLAIAFLSLYLVDDVLARAGRSSGGSSRSSVGSRGSRTSTPPKQATRTPQPSAQQQTQRPVQQPAMQPAPASGGFWRGVAGGVVGGMLGGMLFSSLGFGGGHAGGAGYGGGGGGGLFGGIGLFDILIIALIGYIIYRIVKSRRQQNASISNYGGGDYSTGQYQIEQPPVEPYYRSELQEGLDNIRQYDRSFDETRFTDIVSDIFFKVQSAWSRRDLSPVRNLMAPDIFGDLGADIAKLKAEGHINKLENIGVREVRISEAWQETGKDFITVEIAASMIDYTTDEAGRVVEGDNNTPVGFMEYWTFVRDIGSSNWQLTAIQQPG